MVTILRVQISGLCKEEVVSGVKPAIYAPLILLPFLLHDRKQVLALVVVVLIDPTF